MYAGGVERHVGRITSEYGVRRRWRWSRALSGYLSGEVCITTAHKLCRVAFGNTRGLVGVRVWLSATQRQGFGGGPRYLLGVLIYAALSTAEDTHPPDRVDVAQRHPPPEEDGVRRRWQRCAVGRMVSEYDFGLCAVGRMISDCVLSQDILVCCREDDFGVQ